MRDRVSFTPENAAAFRGELARRGVAQSVVLSTCNRCEVFLWGDEWSVKMCCSAFYLAFPDVELEGQLELRAGDEALVYLFRIAAGLESMVFGEYQILGQVKDAYRAAQTTGHVGRELDRILRDAITAAKRVKTELDIGAVPPSVCEEGMKIVNRLVGIAGKRVFVIGSGKTGSLAAFIANRRGARSVAVCNRSPERTRHLVEIIGARPVDYAARAAVIAESDIVISATASPHIVVKADELKLTHPVTFLDLASPRDIDPAVADNPLATLVSIDTIGELAAGRRRERERLDERGMKIILQLAAETSAFLKS